MSRTEYLLKSEVETGVTLYANPVPDYPENGNTILATTNTLYYVFAGLSKETEYTIHIQSGVSPSNVDEAIGVIWKETFDVNITNNGGTITQMNVPKQVGSQLLIISGDDYTAASDRGRFIWSTSVDYSGHTGTCSVWLGKDAPIFTSTDVETDETSVEVGFTDVQTALLDKRQYNFCVSLTKDGLKVTPIYGHVIVIFERKE